MLENGMYYQDLMNSLAETVSMYVDGDRSLLWFAVLRLEGAIFLWMDTLCLLSSPWSLTSQCNVHELVFCYSSLIYKMHSFPMFSWKKNIQGRNNRATATGKIVIK
jgi:hypothetical protein